jgi:two-component system sensor histidine kinase KdpD
MNQIKHMLSFRREQKYPWKGYICDFLLALGGTGIVSLLIFPLHLYPRIPNVSIIYIVVVLILGSRRGLFAAVLAAVLAFFEFDFLFVEPRFTFSITHPEEWLALFIFLCTAIITGQLAAALRLRAEQARQREKETRVLYEMVRDTNNKENLNHQLEVIARTLCEVFAERGVRDCLILLPDENGRPVLRVSAYQPIDQLQLSANELTTAAWVMREGQSVEFYDLARGSRKVKDSYASSLVIRSTVLPGIARRYLSLFPLRASQKPVGVLCLLMEEDLSHFSREKRFASEADRSDPRSAFFWAFIDQATSMIEHARLHRESLQVEVLQRTDELRAALISSVSHDLRTPLTSIKAAASSLLQDDVQWDDEARRSFMLAIEHEADRLNRLVENLLDLSRIEGGALQPEKEWYPLGELLHDVLARMQPLLQGRVVTTDLPPNLPPVKLDYMMIDQVLTNLLENALRYTPTSSPIEISVSTTTTEVLLAVVDRGPGIPPDDLERIFDKFYRVMGHTREISGSGVGLAVCRGLVEAHGGRIWAVNRPGGGAIFRLTLPLQTESGGPAAALHAG